MCVGSNWRSAEFQFRARVRGSLSASAWNWNGALLALLAAVALAALSSCKKSAPRDSAEERTHPSPGSNHQSEVIARVHWLGKKRIAAETNSAYFMKIWDLPETLKLEAQTLDKLSTAPWRLLQGMTNTAPLPASSQPSTNDSQSRSQSPTIGSSALLRPLLDDLVQQEWYVEVRQATNQPGEAAFAIRLDAARAGLWETNLAVVLESLTDSRVVSAQGGRPGWRLQLTHHTSRSTNSASSSATALQRSNTETLQPANSPILANYIELARAGEWTLISLAQEHNALLGDLLARIQPRPSTERRGTPFALRTANFWLEADLDLLRLASAYAPGWSLPDNSPRIALTMMGDGESVRTRGQLEFPKPLRFDLEPWNIPTNFIHDPLIGFTALQGIRPWLSSLRFWNDPQLGAPPNQIYFWAQAGLPFLAYFCAPLADASNQVNRLAERLMEEANPWLVANAMGKVERSKDVTGAAWMDLPIIAPYLHSVASSGGSFALGALVQSAGSNRPPQELFAQFLSRTNLIYYDWELTGERVVAWLHVGQLFRLIWNRAQLPSQSASMAWLTVAGPRLGNCVSSVTLTGRDHLSFVRMSSIGLTAVEVHVLADWFESPEFPRGLHTLLAQNPTWSPRNKKTAAKSPSFSEPARAEPSK